MCENKEEERKCYLFLFVFYKEDVEKVIFVGKVGWGEGVLVVGLGEGVVGGGLDVWR